MGGGEFPERRVIPAPRFFFPFPVMASTAKRHGEPTALLKPSTKPSTELEAVMLSLARELAGELDDADLPRCCAICFRTFVSAVVWLGASVAEGIVVAIRRECPDFCDSVVRMACAPRTPSTVALTERALERRVSSCPRSDSHDGPGSGHDPLGGLSSAGGLVSSYEVVMDTAFACLLLLFEGGDTSPGMRALERSKFLSPRRGPTLWPSSVSKISPYGEKVCLKSIVSFCTVAKFSPNAQRWLSAYLNVLPSRLVPLVLDDGALHCDVVRLISSCTANTEETRLPDISGVLLAVLSAGHAVFERFVAGREADLLPAVTLMVEVSLSSTSAARPSLPRVHKLLASCAVYLAEKLGLDEDSLPKSVQELKVGVEEPFELGRLVEIALREVRRARKCARAGCHVHDLDGLELLQCSRCKLVKYCGSPCQKFDWKTGAAFSHRVLCPLIVESKNRWPAFTFGDLRTLARFSFDNLPHLLRLHMQYHVSPTIFVYCLPQDL